MNPRRSRQVLTGISQPQLGRREKDMRSKFSDVGSNVQSTGGSDVDRSQVGID